MRLTSRYRPVVGRRLHERHSIRPGAPVVVLLHGVGASSRYLLPTAGRLATDCTVYAPDLLGFGRSARLPGRPTVPRLAETLEAWLDAAGLERPDALVANSFGCQLAVELAVRRPERVARLVLVGPTVDPRARSLVRQAARLAVDLPREPVALWAVQALDYSLHVAKTGVAAFVEMVRDEVETKLAEVIAPALVVRGARDPIAPHAWAAEIAARLPRGRLVEIPRAAHAANYSAPDALARLVRDFLRAE
jgi:pimeloyl-ACP methyl ester carboxylesterase